MTMMKKNNPLLKILNNSINELPTPSNISMWWNFGSLLGLCLMIQILTGLFLAMHYTGDVSVAFESVVHITRDVNYGWLIRTMHANGASMFFICMYMHIGRGLYYSSYFFVGTWMVGVIMLFMVMATAFVGYVLPWGQMSFWGATVITNLLSAVPYLGTTLVQWVWGGFAIENATLTRFFALHFIMPFVIAAMSMVHLMLLHQTGSNNPMGINSNYDKISFHPFFSFKDMVGFIVLIWALAWISTVSPYMLGDCENFISANPLVTPVHIQPEWYFLFAYAILRSIPNKLGGVIALVTSIAILFILPITGSMKSRGAQFYLVNQVMFWYFLNTVILLTWVGACPVEEPYILLGQTLTVMYFSWFFVTPVLTMTWEKMLN